MYCTGFVPFAFKVSQSVVCLLCINYQYTQWIFFFCCRSPPVRCDDAEGDAGGASSAVAKKAIEPLSLEADDDRASAIATEAMLMFRKGTSAADVRKIVETHLTGGFCECKRSSPTHVNHAFTLFISNVPPVTLDESLTVECLSIVRLMLFKRRRLPSLNLSECPALDDACSALTTSDPWWRFILSKLSSSNEFVRYEAVCASSEFVLLCSAVDGETSASSRLYAPLISPIVKSAISPSACCAVLDVLKQVLESSDRRTQSIKGKLLRYLRSSWSRIVDVLVTNENNTYHQTEELLSLWYAVFVALQSQDRELGHHYLVCLSKIESKLMCNTRPLLWLQTVRVFSVALVIRSAVPSYCRDVMSVAKIVLRNLQKSRLLRSMHKVKNVFSWSGSQSIGLQDTLMLALRAMRVYVNCARSRTQAAASVVIMVERLDVYIKSTMLYASDMPFSRWLVRLMFDRDDVVVECLMCAIDIATVAPSSRLLFEPLESFAELAACVAYDETLFYDYLISNETEFLLYMLKILKTAVLDVHRFFRCCGDALNNVMDLLNRLRDKLLGQCFPYNIKPVTKLIDRCGDLYNELVLGPEPLETLPFDD